MIDRRGILMKKKGMKLTPAEWEIMEAVWKLGESPSIRDVLEYAYPKGEKAYTTVQTVMNTLVRKGALRRKKLGLVNFYKPVHPREDMVRDEVRSLLGRVFSGNIPAVANSLLELDSLGLEEIEEIKKLLKKRERELKEGSS
jgi:BlaI family penicillinase repressor